jgi:hypothetical protein
MALRQLSRYQRHFDSYSTDEHEHSVHHTLVEITCLLLLLRDARALPFEAPTVGGEVDDGWSTPQKRANGKQYSNMRQ